MKKVLLATMIMTASLNLMACASENKESTNVSQEITTEEQTTEKSMETTDTASPETTEAAITETAADKTSANKTAPEHKAADTGEDKRLDNFEIDKKTVNDYAEKIKAAVAEKDIEKLGELVSYPTYVGFPDGGLVIENKEDFIALSPDKLFTPELLSSIAETNFDALEPSMAGFTMAKEYKSGIPSITFSVVEGGLGITGINY